jgi:hypothetical protein
MPAILRLSLIDASNEIYLLLLTIAGEESNTYDALDMAIRGLRQPLGTTEAP